ncbi:hypothetical protein [Larsenimonas rhizosphaerae]|uniref:Uncharacterized protein n=1 Tax=Larsenimonas rhizosphaerae TaxID=2944682 RepID=A0AA42CXX9_9GAMM|nr:hypothetical protein [Larsenimonas rhizosphaerae]MCX2524408.1 hypothetical protein [Larsenimonas rhizosphaerae]
MAQQRSTPQPPLSETDIDYEPPVTASDDDVQGDAMSGTADTMDAEQLPQEFEDEASMAVTGGRDRDEALLEEKERQLENELEVTDADAEGIEGNIKSLDFNDDDDMSAVTPSDAEDDEDRLPN